MRTTFVWESVDSSARVTFSHCAQPLSFFMSTCLAAGRRSVDYQAKNSVLSQIRLRHLTTVNPSPR